MDRRPCRPYIATKIGKRLTGGTFSKCEITRRHAPPPSAPLSPIDAEQECDSASAAFSGELPRAANAKARLVGHEQSGLLGAGGDSIIRDTGHGVSPCRD